MYAHDIASSFDEFLKNLLRGLKQKKPGWHRVFSNDRMWSTENPGRLV